MSKRIKVNCYQIPIAALIFLFSVQVHSRMVSIDQTNIPNGVIIKFLDRKHGIVCYILRPRSLAYQNVDKFQRRRWKSYAGNNIGSISCVKLRR